MKRYLQANREVWDRLLEVHLKSDFYDLEVFKAGKCMLDPIEVKELGDVRNKTLLHLQCHFGQDTICWKRRGAVVTGVDFSEKAIHVANSLAREIGIEATFICSEISELPAKLSGNFDIVFTSGGVITWLPNLKSWAQVAASFVKPGGIFYMREFHPFAYVFHDDEETGTVPVVHYPYFEQQEPLIAESQGSYADTSSDIQFVTYEWPHSMSEIINSLVEAGLHIDFLHEFPYTSYQANPFLKRSPNGERWHYPGLQGGLPLMFSIQASKP